MSADDGKVEFGVGSSGWRWGGIRDAIEIAFVVGGLKWLL